MDYGLWAQRVSNEQSHWRRMKADVTGKTVRELRSHRERERKRERERDMSVYLALKKTLGLLKVWKHANIIMGKLDFGMKNSVIYCVVSRIKRQFEAL